MLFSGRKRCKGADPVAFTFSFDLRATKEYSRSPVPRRIQIMFTRLTAVTSGFPMGPVAKDRAEHIPSATVKLGPRRPVRRIRT